MKQTSDPSQIVGCPENLNQRDMNNQSTTQTESASRAIQPWPNVRRTTIIVGPIAAELDAALARELALLLTIESRPFTAGPAGVNSMASTASQFGIKRDSCPCWLASWRRTARCSTQLQRQCEVRG